MDSIPTCSSVTNFTCSYYIYLLVITSSTVSAFSLYNISSAAPWLNVFAAENLNTASTATSQIIKGLPECTMTSPEIIRYFGYPVEIHHLTTEDGYILELHRIPRQKDGTNLYSGEPVLLMHGMFSSSSAWISNQPNQSLGFILSDGGFDVWLGNIRGSAYSANHSYQNTMSKEFWKFSFDEIGKYDLPETIDYILSETSSQQIYLVAHSMGSTATFAMLSTEAGYNDKIKVFFALAPVTAIGHPHFLPLILLGNFTTEIELLGAALGVHHIGGDNILATITRTICTAGMDNLCKDVYMLSVPGATPDSKELNMTRMCFYGISSIVSATSLQTLRHYAQNMQEKMFRHYDWGFFTNLLKYGETEPPTYDLTKVTAPVVLFYGLNDLLATPEDVNVTARKLPNLIESVQAGGENFGHVDFVIGINDAVQVYHKIINTIYHN